MLKSAPLTLLIISLLVAGCTLPASNISPPTRLPELLYTQAVATIVSQMTQSVGTPSQEGNGTVQAATPESSPLPAATATQASVFTATIAPTATYTFTPTVSPTALPATSTPASNDLRLSLGEPAFRDPMDSAENWPVYTDDHVKFEVNDGKMVMTAFKPDFYNGWMLSWVNLGDFYLEITATQGACSGRDRYGVVFRSPDMNTGYLFAFACDGRYSLWYWDGKNEIDIVDWQTSSLIQAGEGKTNRLGVRVQADRIALYANGSLLTEVQDSSSSQGNIGLLVGSAETTNYTAYIDELSYWNLK